MQFVSAISFALFALWGVYALDRKYRQHHELPVMAQAVTLLCLILFFAFEMAQLRIWFRDMPVGYLFTGLGLLVSGMALYGHMAVSLTSRIIVDVVVPGDDSAPDRPRFGPAEMLERQRDFEGAVQEYLVLARIYPRNATIYTRIADNLMTLERPEEAVDWFERALNHVTSDDQALLLVNRLAEVYSRKLGRPGDAQNALEAFLSKHPDSPSAEALRARLEAVGAEDAPPVISTGLAALEENPLDMEEPCAAEAPPLLPEAAEAPESASITLEPLAELDAAEPNAEPEELVEERHGRRKAALPSLEALEDDPEPVNEVEGDGPDSSEPPNPGSGLEAL